MPKKYRHTLAGIAIIGMVAAVWYCGFYRQPNLYACIAGPLTALGGVSLNFLLRAYLRHDQKMKCCKKSQSANLVLDGEKKKKYRFGREVQKRQYKITLLIF